MPRRTRVPYGALPSQFREEWVPESAAPAGIAVTIHGGWWRDAHDLHLMDPLCERLAGAGWVVQNLEYRRTGTDGGGWPQTFEDVKAALRGVEREKARPLVLVGHSAGGHLALLAGPLAGADGVVALAPVTDLPRSAAEGLGEGATTLFLRDARVGDPAYREASPLHALPLGVDTLVVHGDADPRVPVAHSRDYVRRAEGAGESIECWEVAGGDHFCVIDPDEPVWDRIPAWMAARGQR
jgi:acetyl esterase/lipase